MTIGEALTEASGTLNPVSDTPFLDSSVLLSRVLEITKERLYASYPDTISAQRYEDFVRIIEKRRMGSPIAYLVGTKEFYGLDFVVDPRVLIPRPETELLVELALSLTSARRYLDICTGSGCVAVAIAANRSGIEITASDVSPGAIEVCAMNVDRYNLGIELARGDLFSSVNGEFDCITANPPYLTESEWKRNYGDEWTEPSLALVGGSQGLDTIRRIVRDVVDYLAPGGHFYLEAAPEQMDEIGKMLLQARFGAVTLYQDMRRQNRVIGGVWNT